jgi:hypothetical protein
LPLKLSWEVLALEIPGPLGFGEAADIYVVSCSPHGLIAGILGIMTWLLATLAIRLNFSGPGKAVPLTVVTVFALSALAATTGAASMLIAGTFALEVQIRPFISHFLQWQ